MACRTSLFVLLLVAAMSAVATATTIATGRSSGDDNTKEASRGTSEWGRGFKKKYGGHYYSSSAYPSKKHKKYNKNNNKHSFNDKPKGDQKKCLDYKLMKVPERDPITPPGVEVFIFVTDECHHDDQCCNGGVCNRKADISLLETSPPNECAIAPTVRNVEGDEAFPALDAPRGNQCCLPDGTPVGGLTGKGLSVNVTIASLCCSGRVMENIGPIVEPNPTLACGYSSA